MHGYLIIWTYFSVHTYAIKNIGWKLLILSFFEKMAPTFRHFQKKSIFKQKFKIFNPTLHYYSVTPNYQNFYQDHFRAYFANFGSYLHAYFYAYFLQPEIMNVNIFRRFLYSSIDCDFLSLLYWDENLFQRSNTTRPKYRIFGAETKTHTTNWSSVGKWCSRLSK